MRYLDLLKKIEEESNEGSISESPCYEKTKKGDTERGHSRVAWQSPRFGLLSGRLVWRVKEGWALIEGESLFCWVRECHLKQ